MIDHPLQGRRIAVVEDEPIIKLEVEDALMDAGASIAKSVADRIDAAVLDISLKGSLSGTHIAVALRLRSIPFIFYSGAEAEVAAPVRARFPGSPFVSKPSCREEIVKAIVGVMRPRPVRA